MSSTGNDGVGLEDLDALQLELEMLLYAAVDKEWKLQQEQSVLNVLEGVRGVKRKGSPCKPVCISTRQCVPVYGWAGQ